MFLQNANLQITALSGRRFQSDTARLLELPLFCIEFSLSISTENTYDKSPIALVKQYPCHAIYLACDKSL